nr:long-chain fatty acid--CoA ligase [Candidatus Freyarchaeota archaeon]
MEDEEYLSKPWLNHYDPDIPQTIKYPKIPIYETLNKSVKDFPEKPALYWGKRAINYRTLGEYVDRFSNALTDLGIKKGDRVALLMLNTPQYVISLYGILKAGAVATGINPLLTPREIEFILTDSGAETIITLDLFLPRVIEVKDKTKLKNIIVTGLGDFPQTDAPLPEPPEKEGVKQFLTLLKNHPPKPPKIKINPEEDAAILQYTGGTTGLPKGVVLTHRNIVSNIHQVYTWFNPTFGTDTFCSAFPMFHVAGLIVNLVAVTLGGVQCLIWNPRDSDNIIQLINDYKPKWIVNVPTLYMMLLANPKFFKSEVVNAEQFLSAAAPMPVEIIKELQTKTKGVVVEIWGLTETSPAATIMPFKGTKKAGSVGLPLADTIVKVVDIESRETLPVGEKGELAVYGPQVFYKGYRNKPEETANALQDGWVYTGDVGYMDEDGYFYIIDRTKDMINVSGYKVFSREVDEVLHEHPAVALAATIGIPDPERPGSERVKAFIVLKQGYQESPELKEDILKFLQKNLAKYKVPKFIEFRKELPMSLTGKVLKRQLRE